MAGSTSSTTLPAPWRARSTRRATSRRRSYAALLTRASAKRGFIRRDTVEMNLGKVESLHVNQGLLGRMLNYGDVTVVGTGSSLEPLRGISGPLELRRKLGEIAAPAAGPGGSQP